MVATSVPVRKSLTWTVDDGRGRDAFRGNMSTSVAPNGRCHFDPKLMPMPTPGPTSTTDDIQPARKVPGLAFGRATEPRSKSPDPRAPRPKGGRRRRATPRERDARALRHDLRPGRAARRRDLPPAGVAPQVPDRLRGARGARRAVRGHEIPHGRRKTMLFVKPPKVVSPGPVYDLRTRLGRDVRLIKPAAFVKERKFEQARFEGTHRRRRRGDEVLPAVRGPRVDADVAVGADAVAAVLGSRMTTPGKPVCDVKNMMRLYNVAQIAVCGYMTLGLLPVLGWRTSSASTEFTEAGEWATRRSSSFLHVYHHSTIGVVWGILLASGNGNGTARYGALINSVTHVFMYTHYLWTSFKFKNPFKALLTKWQIAQFYSCFLHAVLVLSGVFVVETKIDKELAWLQFCYHITMVYLFTFQMAWIPKCCVPLSRLDDAAPASSKKRA
ncbi:hypothetical protein JL720_12962 [Aureococcus anophagefferens]|nr:hypothetical protein JL720_12962 [Aureococcus anophagefferens]